MKKLLTTLVVLLAAALAAAITRPEKEAHLDKIKEVISESIASGLSLEGNGPSPFKPSLVIGANCHASARRVLDTVRKHLPALPY